MSTVAASSTPLFVRLNTTCTTDPATGVEGCYSAVVRDRRGPPRAPRVTERHPVILDVDTGIDDSLALLYACASPEAALVAATRAAGGCEHARGPGAGRSRGRRSGAGARNAAGAAPHDDAGDARAAGHRLCGAAAAAPAATSP